MGEVSGVLELSCAVQKYHWGKRGSNSLVAQLAVKGHHLPSIDEATTYAELWMGTHPSCPSKIRGTDKSLAAHIAEHPDCLGSGVCTAFGPQLPFLFKVLSVDTALSIQAHPNKVLAKKLHEAHPELYPDPNHKPEIAIALTEFEAFCNFRPLQEISSLLKGLPELRQVLGPVMEQPLETKQQLQAYFQAVMTASPEVFRPPLNKLYKRLEKNAADSLGIPQDLCQVFLRVHQSYPGDIGCFVIFFLNYVKLQPGEALFLAANEPHAYISGDCMECMACSDNVVRAGLTPKHKDVSTLCAMLSYDPVAPDKLRFPAVSSSCDACSFTPPIPDFAVNYVQVEANSTHPLKPLGSASILLVVQGTGKAGSIELHRGKVLFLAALKELSVTATEAITLYQAYCPA